MGKDLYAPEPVYSLLVRSTRSRVDSMASRKSWFSRKF